MAPADRTYDGPRSRLPSWHTPADGDRLFGIDAIARYLGLPFLDVRTMISAGHLPTERESRAHTSRRTDLARFVLHAERAAGAGCFVAPPPADLRPDGCLGLLKGWAAMGEHVGERATTMRYHGEAGRLPAFRVGALRFARGASLDAFAAETFPAAAGLAESDLLVGVEAIAAWLRIDYLTARDWCRLGYIPTDRRRGRVCADRGALARHVAALERQACPPQFVGRVPRDLRRNGALGLVRGYRAIGAACGIAPHNVQYAIESKGLPTFYVGRVRTARRASLDRFQAAVAARSSLPIAQMELS